MYQKILVPLDGSALADQVIPHGVAIAQAMEASLMLLHVEDPSLSPMEMFGAGTEAAALDAQREVEEREIAHHLEELQRTIQADGLPDVELVIVEGSPAEAIIARAKDLECDLIVMASRGRGGMRRAVFGSVADHVVRNTPDAAVLIITPEPDDD